MERVDQKELDEMLSRPRQLNEFLAKMAENQIYREEANTIKNTESKLSNIIRNAALNPHHAKAEFETQYNDFLENQMISILEYLQGKKDQNSLQIFRELCRLTGITPIAPSEGAAYDPGKHEGISFIPTSADKRRRILNVVQNGLEMNGKVYRKAKVEVGQ